MVYVISVIVNLTEGCCVRVVSISMLSSLETSGRLMEFDGRDGKLRVHYSDRLVALLREVRQLSALGLSLPTKIITTAQTARKFYRHGVVLKQVYTTIVNILEKLNLGSDLVPDPMVLLITPAISITFTFECLFLSVYPHPLLPPILLVHL